MKPLKELTREEKLELLAAVESGSIPPEDLNETTMVENDQEIMYLSLQDWAKAEEDGRGYTLILLGPKANGFERLRDFYRAIYRWEKQYYEEQAGEEYFKKINGIWQHEHIGESNR